MKTFPTRLDMIKALPPKAVMAEVGVWRGYFSIEILNHANVGKLYLIDSWENFDADHNEESFKECLHTLRGHLPGGRVEVIRNRSLDAVKDFKEASLDAVYIDASHDYKDVLDDLRAWRRIIKPGGVILGHDYTRNEMARRLHFGVIEAVETFCAESDWHLEALTDEDFASFCLKRDIPRIVHAIWFGNKPVSEMSPLNKRCIESIVDVLPDYDFKLWTNADAKNLPWVKRAIDEGHICAAANYFRLYQLLKFGGVHVDLDVEMRRPFDLTPACFIGFQRQDTQKDCINTAVMGCLPNHWFPRHLLDLFDHTEPKHGALALGTTKPTEELYKLGLIGLNATQMVRDIKVFSRDYFHPIDWNDRTKDYTTSNTVCVHHFESSWTK